MSDRKREIDTAIKSLSNTIKRYVVPKFRSIIEMCSNVDEYRKWTCEMELEQFEEPCNEQCDYCNSYYPNQPETE